MQELSVGLDAVGIAHTVHLDGLKGPDRHGFTCVKILTVAVHAVVVTELRVDLPAVAVGNQLHVEAILVEHTTSVPVIVLTLVFL